jgi:hypothetical protein
MKTASWTTCIIRGLPITLAAFPCFGLPSQKGKEEDTSLPLSFKRCAYWDMGKAVAE